ncbi:MAG: DUF58 domain-containing protein [Spirochaetes bacterium]|jgi:uncharacterized protein (DUF58 family)|nr:DUF58 domain-containing protein [Spirochaetota bacterium]
MKTLLFFVKNLYLERNFFLCAGALCVFGFVAFFFEEFLNPLILLTIIFIPLSLVEIVHTAIISGRFSARRIMSTKLSNGEFNPVTIEIRSDHSRKTDIDCIDEAPIQLQIRDARFSVKAGPHTLTTITYKVRPVKRGLYTFGSVYLFIRSPLGFASFRREFEAGRSVPVYPSIMALKEYDFYASSHNLRDPGLKQVRRSAVAHEFDALRNYRYGDEFRAINWKATARKSHLIVNNYMEDRSQPIYSVLDTGRSMEMPFNGMSLIDYAVNSALILSNVALKRHDKAGIITFNADGCNTLKADNHSSQLSKILNQLYNCINDHREVSYEKLFITVNRQLHHRSLLLIYTNFETVYSMHRALPLLRLLSRKHLLVVITFRNTEMEKCILEPADSVEKIYRSAIASEFTRNKELIHKEFIKNGIHSIVTSYNKLTVQLINKYLELKAGGLL